MPNKLYVVGTPIGNLEDISKRAVNTLNNVDFIAAEDSRVTLKLLNFLGIKKTICSYYEYNKEEKSETICRKILEGKSCALVSDAGMPCISDPGEFLVQKCIDYNIPVEVVPGPCAISSALSLAGIFGGKFSFYGFLNVNKKRRNETLKEIKEETKALVLYEAPHKLKRTLSDLYKVLGERNIVLVKEMTKIHEKAIHLTLSKALLSLENTFGLKGEFVIVIKPNTKKTKTRCVDSDLDYALSLFENYLKSGQSKSEAIKLVSKETGLRKNLIYEKIIKNDL